MRTPGCAVTAETLLRCSETYSARMPKLKILERRYLLGSYLITNFHGSHYVLRLEQNAP